MRSRPTKRQVQAEETMNAVRCAMADARQSVSHAESALRSARDALERMEAAEGIFRPLLIAIFDDESEPRSVDLGD
jgi:hypothetical protein